MTSEESGFWDRRYREEGAVWGEEPSPTALLLAPLLAPRSRVLDVGFGYGRDLVYLAERGFRVSGVDGSGDGHVQARRRLADRGLQAENLYRGRFEDAALPPERFDAVLNHRMAHLLTSVEAVAAFAARIRQVLRPRGLLALAARSVLDHDPDQMIEVEPGVYEYRSRPGHRIRYWDESSVRLLCSGAFDLLTFQAGNEPETLTKPIPCHLLLLIARKTVGAAPEGGRPTASEPNAPALFTRPPAEEAPSHEPSSWAEFVLTHPAPAPSGPPSPDAEAKCARYARASGMAVLAASLVVLLSHGWESMDSAGRYAKTQEVLQGVFAADMTPVAFSTGLSFFLCGMALLLSAVQPMTRGRRLIVQGATGLVIGWGLYVVFAFAVGNRIALPTDGALPDAFGKTPMSAFTAAIFVVAGLALLSLLGKSNPSCRALASICVCALGLITLLILLAYAYQIQFLRETLKLNVPVAPLTALAFLGLDVGMIGALGPSCFPLRPFVGASPRTLMLRSFLPVVVGLFVGSLVLDAWVRDAISHAPDAVYQNELVLYSAALCLAGVGVTALVVGSMSARIGARIDKAEAKRDEALNRMAGTIDALRRTREQLEQANQHATEANRLLSEANADLAQARDKAEQVSVAKDFFLATVSHELRTPLNHVIGYLQLLEMTTLDDDQQRDLSKVHNAAHNLLGLVNDLLDYQKMLQGALTLEPASLDLAPWVEDLADAMRPKVGERGNQLVVDCPADMGALEADEKRARQALTNLLSNAAKFTRDGVVTLSVRRERDGTSEWVRLDVRDTGRGMTEPQQAKLFQPFTKLLSRSENPEGTGLGLALSQRLCRLMGGDLTLSHSEPGRGSTFTIRLPATPAAVGAPPPTPPRPAALLGKLAAAPKPASILVIDDDPEVRELMRRHLEAHGFIVHQAASGAEGLEMVKRLEPDAITLDVLMPGIDGWGTLAALQADAQTAGIPVILITMLDDRTRGFALGAWEVLTKPISWSRLIDLLSNIEPNTGPVLLVDDDAAFRELAQRTLSRHGWEVCCAGDGRAGLAAAARRRPALVLLDLLMPIMDGFEFLEAFRMDAAWREVPVVVVTAKQLTAEDHRRLDGSVLRILPKGMSSLDDLMREVERLLHNHTDAAGPEPERADAAEQPA